MYTETQEKIEECLVCACKGTGNFNTIESIQQLAQDLLKTLFDIKGNIFYNITLTDEQLFDISNNCSSTFRP